MSGNQRGASANEFTLGFVDAVTGDLIASSGTSFNILSADPFGLEGLNFQSNTAFDVRLFFQSSGTNNIGPILDNVSFFDNRVSVSEPGALRLLGLGLLGLAALRLRRNA